MKTIARLFREVRIEVLKVAFLNSFLNACMFFFAVYLGIIFLDFSFMWAVAVSIIFFIIDFLYWHRKLDLKAVEDSNPTVKEMLRTAYDNQEEKNVLVLGLFYDVVKKMRTVSAGNLLDSNLLFKKVLAITLLTFAVVFVSSLEIYAGNIHIPLDQFGREISGFFGGPTGQKKNTSLDIIGFNETTGLYGEESLAKLGKEELNLNLNPSMSELDFDNEKELEDRRFGDDQFPVEPSVQSSEFSGNDIPEEAELAKAYNLELKK
ncbi:hypothetical protein ACFL1B_01040 [Nanoarchaeota archaeon]